AHDLARRARRPRRRDAPRRPHGRRADAQLHLRGGGLARAGAALGDARPLSQAPHGDLRVELDLAAAAPRALGPALQALRQRAALEDRPPAERGLLRAVLHRLRVRRDPYLPAVGPLRGRRRVVVRRLPPRRRRLVERDPRDAPGRRARGGAGEAPRRQRAAHVRYRGDALRDRGAAAARAPGLVPRRRGARALGGGRGRSARARHHQVRPGQARPAPPDAGAPALLMTVVDVDSHVYEPTEIWEKYLERDYRVVARSAFWHEIDAQGLETTILNGHRARPLRPRGFKAAFIRPVFFEGRFPNHPTYDVLWQRLEALDVAACVHPSPGSTNPEWSCAGPFVERVAGNLKVGHPIAESVAPFMDTSTFLTAVAFYGHMEIYPKLKLTLVHAGAAWVPLALEKSETYLWLFSGIRDVSLARRHAKERAVFVFSEDGVRAADPVSVPEERDALLPGDRGAVGQVELLGGERSDAEPFEHRRRHDRVDRARVDQERDRLGDIGAGGVSDLERDGAQPHRTSWRALPAVRLTRVTIAERRDTRQRLRPPRPHYAGATPADYELSLISRRANTRQATAMA